MSLKSELLIYQAALAAYDSSQLSSALTTFTKISETSKVQWNMGVILAEMGRHGEAVKHFGESLGMDKYLVVGWFQRGVSYFMMGLYENALKDFEMAYQNMRSNKTINYTQLGLAHTIHSAEILLNIGLTKIHLGRTAAGMIDLRKAQEEKMIPEHSFIDDAVRGRGRGCNVVTVPAGLLFRPSDSKLKNIKTRDYMGKAILVSASDANDAYTTFTGITRLNRGQTPKGVALDPAHPLARSRSQLQVKPLALTRSASVSAIPGPDSNLPIANRMAKRSPLPSPGLGLIRSLTISNPDPASPRSPGHIRAHTVDSASIYSAANAGLPRLGGDGRPIRPRVVIPPTGEDDNSRVPNFRPRDQSDRYPPFPTAHGQNRSKPQPPSSYPQDNPSRPWWQGSSEPHRYTPIITHQQYTPKRSPSRFQSSPTPVADQEILQTPQDRLEGLESIYDDYHSPEPIPDLIKDSPDVDTRGDMPYTAIGQAFAAAPLSPLPVKQVNYIPTQPRRLPSRSNGTLLRSNTSTSTPRYQGPGQGQGGLLLTVEDGTLPSTVVSANLTKIRIKVHVGKHTRGMSIFPDDTYEHLVILLRQKFPELRGKRGVSVSFRDEDGDMLSMQDDGDFEAAVDVARVLSRGRAEGRLEIWVE